MLTHNRHRLHLFIPNAFCINANICKWRAEMQLGVVC